MDFDNFLSDIGHAVARSHGQAAERTQALHLQAVVPHRQETEARRRLPNNVRKIDASHLYNCNFGMQVMAVSGASKNIFIYFRNTQLTVTQQVSCYRNF